MKPYLYLLLLVAALLMLLPLPALSAASHPDKPAMGEPDTDSSGTPPDALDPQDTGVFRLLAGDTVVELTERDFLIRTLAFEMSPTDHTQALQAQAVAAYTYYARRRQLQRQAPDEVLKGADFASPADTFPEEFSPEALQARWGDQYDTYYRKLCAAVDAVTGKRITYQGELIDACYFCLSCGSTESAKVVWGSDVPYLQSVASPGDRLSPEYESVITMTSEQVSKAFADAGEKLTLPKDPADWFGEAVMSEAGTVVTIPVGGQTLSGTAVRRALSLRSAAFSVTCTEGKFRFTVHGHGHGVGLSQYGADYLARQGYDWKEILLYYYTGVTVE